MLCTTRTGSQLHLLPCFLQRSRMIYSHRDLFLSITLPLVVATCDPFEFYNDWFFSFMHQSNQYIATGVYIHHFVPIHG